MAEDRAPDPGGRARDEAAGRAAWLAVMVIAIPVLAWVERQAKDPVAWQQTKMRAAKSVERFAVRAAHEWFALAERARLAYEAERPL